MTPSKKSSNQIKVLAKYLPAEFVDHVYQLIIAHPLDFAIVRPRKSKLGDFRMNSNGKRPAITVNGNLNQFSFLITTIHELAHFYAFKNYGLRILAHGKEWQKTYRDMLLPVIETGHLPKDIETALMNSLITVKASSCTDLNLYRVLKKYDERHGEITLLEDLPPHSLFLLNGKKFEKGHLRRKRYLCTEIQTKRQFLVSAVAEVEVEQLD